MQAPTGSILKEKSGTLTIPPLASGPEEITNAHRQSLRKRNDALLVSLAQDPEIRTPLRHLRLPDRQELADAETRQI
jgi:hypothetical protein